MKLIKVTHEGAKSIAGDTHLPVELNVLLLQELRYVCKRAQIDRLAIDQERLFLFNLAHDLARIFILLAGAIASNRSKSHILLVVRHDRLLNTL